MPTGKRTRAKAKRQRQLAGHTHLAAHNDRVCLQLEAIFRGFYNAQDEIAVCRLALERLNTPECLDIARVISRSVLVRMDYNLRTLDRLTRSFSGTTEYSNDDEDIDDEAYAEIAKEDPPK